MATPMATRSVSPGGALLRASRVFAIPPPLPRPMEQQSSSAIFTSDSATLPHPIRASITTPQSSLARGDWGFKRPLPLRSTTKSSTPLIRVEAIDTYEHITEYASAADHTITLHKFHEMGVPMTIPVVGDESRVGGYRSDRRQSVFEDSIDYTTGPKRSIGKEDMRWKYKGPYLASQSEGDFSNYLSTEVRKRKGEFQSYLRTACANELTRAAELAATDEMPPPVTEQDVTEEQLTSYIRSLRRDRSALYKHIREFLDLAPVAPPDARAIESMIDNLALTNKGRGSKTSLSSEQFATTLSPFAKTGPPKTHPSAGLSYIRSAAYTPNHPQFGPQKKHTPVKARVVRPKGASGGAFAPTLGVGGFVVDVPGGGPDFNIGNTSKSHANMALQIPGLLQIEPDKVGGSKTYVHPKHASVTPKGKIILTVDSGEPEAIAVLENTTDKIPQPQPARPVGPAGLTRRLKGFSNSSRGYGLSDEVTPRQQPSSQSQGGGDPMTTLGNLMGL